MTRKLFLYIFLPIIGLALMGVSVSNASNRNLSRQALDPTVSSTVEPTQATVIAAGTITPPDRVLPSVGGNAGLVLGASVLVLIIIAGVGFSSRRRAKH